MAKKAKAKKAARSAARSGPTLASFREEFNSLVPAAKKAGLNVRVHTSEFESKEKGRAAVARLKAQIKKGGRAKAKAA